MSGDFDWAITVSCYIVLVLKVLVNLQELKGRIVKHVLIRMHP